VLYFVIHYCLLVVKR